MLALARKIVIACKFLCNANSDNKYGITQLQILLQ